MSVSEIETYPEIREEVRKLCANFPGEYWRRMDREQAYPSEFVQALNDAGYVEELDPNDYALADYFPEFQEFPGNWKDGKTRKSG